MPSETTERTQEPSQRCRACGASIDTDDRFCRQCGARTDGPGPVAKLSGPAGIRALGLIILAAAVVVAFFRYSSWGTEERATASSARIPVSAVGSGPDSRAPMTPRQAADHLFNQAMSAAESGDSTAAAQLVPMALSAYRGLGELDPDARYHVALLHLATDRPRAALAQADTILTQVPDHLLALPVAAEAHRELGQPDSAAALYRRFLEAHDSERASSRPEYIDHQAVFENQLQRARRFLER